MKFLAGVALVFWLVFANVAFAQCGDLASCAGQRAEADARLAEFRRATAVVVATEKAAARQATIEAREMSILATRMAQPTQTPIPSATPLPTLTPEPTKTMHPESTPIVPTAAPIALDQKQGPKANYGQAIAIILLGIATIGGLAVLYRLVVGRSHIE